MIDLEACIEERPTPQGRRGVSNPPVTVVEGGEAGLSVNKLRGK